MNPGFTFGYPIQNKIKQRRFRNSQTVAEELFCIEALKSWQDGGAGGLQLQFMLIYGYKINEIFSSKFISRELPSLTNLGLLAAGK